MVMHLVVLGGLDVGVHQQILKSLEDGARGRFRLLYRGLTVRGDLHLREERRRRSTKGKRREDNHHHRRSTDDVLVVCCAAVSVAGNLVGEGDRNSAAKPREPADHLLANGDDVFGRGCDTVEEVEDREDVHRAHGDGEHDDEQEGFIGIDPMESSALEVLIGDVLELDRDRETDEQIHRVL